MGFTYDDLRSIAKASPCNASWRDMNGDERIRRCAGCNKNVFNLSAMTLLEVEQLMSGSRDRPCLRFFVRPDGTLLTDDCPVGFRRIRRRAVAFGAVVASLIAAVVAVFGLDLRRQFESRCLAWVAKSALLSRILDTTIVELDATVGLPARGFQTNPTRPAKRTPERRETHFEEHGFPLRLADPLRSSDAAIDPVNVFGIATSTPLKRPKILDDHDDKPEEQEAMYAIKPSGRRLHFGIAQQF